MSQKVNYNKSIIYKLCCKDPLITDIYVGSTTNFRKRKFNHKSNCINKNNKGYNYYVYQFIRDNGDFDNWDMIMVEEYSCENKKQLDTRERYWIEQLKSSLNKKIPARTKKEWIQDNITKIKDKRKQYIIDNKDKINQQVRQYNIDNKDKITEYKKEQIECDICNSLIRRDNLSKHKKTLKCIKFKKLIE